MHVAPTDESTVYSGKTPIDLTVHPARATVRHPKRADSRGSRPVRSLCEHPPNTREQDDPHVDETPLPVLGDDRNRRQTTEKNRGKQHKSALTV